MHKAFSPHLTSLGQGDDSDKTKVIKMYVAILGYQ